MRRVECVLTDNGKIEYAGRTYTSDADISKIIDGIMLSRDRFLNGLAFEEKTDLVATMLKIGIPITKIAVLLFLTDDEIKQYI